MQPVGAGGAVQAGRAGDTGLTAWAAGWPAAPNQRHPARIKAALERRKAEGKPVGGAAAKRGKNRKPRRRDGYLAA